MATRPNTSDLAAAGHITGVIAFDMRDPAQVAALHSAWSFTPVEKAEHRVGAARTAVKEWCARHLTPDQRIGLLLSPVVPGLSAERAAELDDLRAGVERALADLEATKNTAVRAWVEIAAYEYRKASASLAKVAA